MPAWDPLSGALALPSAGAAVQFYDTVHDRRGDSSSLSSVAPARCHLKARAVLARPVVAVGPQSSAESLHTCLSPDAWL